MNMKKINLTIAFLLLFGALGNLFSQVTGYEDARLIALKSFGELLSRDSKSIAINDDYYVKLIDDQPVVYIFTETDGGFVIVSGEERTVPVLGYSDNGAPSMDETEWNPEFAYWMQIYENQIVYLRENNLSALPQAEIQRSKLINGEDIGIRPAKDVAPLLSTTWNQGCGYNAQCPVDAAGPCGRVYTGCVATAMAQVIRYMEYPVNGTGNKCYYHYVYGDQCADFAAATYDYSIMTNGSGNAEVAELMYHCGVSVSMGYSPTGSGAYSHNVVTALKDYFDYKNVVILNKGTYTDANWNRILRNEIDNNRPMYYSGSGGSGGHAFVFDGYQGLDFFHINWGWGGSYNGYFYCNDLTPGSYSFNNSQNVIVGAIPAPLFTNLDVSSAIELSCATPLAQNLSTGDDYINYYKNTYPQTPGKELVYYFTTTMPGRIRVKITNSTDGSLNAFLLSHPHQDSLITYGANGFILDDTNPGTYWLAIESSSAAEPTFDIEVICPTIDADLIIVNGSVSPQYVESDQPNVNFSCNIKNIGNTDAGANTIEYFISDDAVFNFGTDVFIGSDVVPALASGTSANITTVLTMPSGLTPGGKNIVYVVDRANIVVESDDQNEYFSWITVPDPGLLDCSTSISITEGVWYYDNTQTNGVNNVEDYWPATDQNAPEIIHSFIAPYSGRATLYLTEKVPGDMKAMVYPVCNENTWLGSTWFANITDTIATTEFFVNAGTEYFLVVDSKLPVQGAYGVKVDLPAECPDPIIEMWGDTTLCDGAAFPSFWTAWGFPNYQWYKNGIALPNEIWSSYSPTEAGSYYVEITENGCTGQSVPISVTMSFPPDTAQITSVGATSFCNGGDVTLQMTNAVLYPLQWTKDGQDILGENSDTYTATESGIYRLNTINGSCTLASAQQIEVEVAELPVDIGELVPFPSDTAEFFYSFNEDSYDDINNYQFSCWNFIPADDRDGNFWQARDFTDADIFGYSSHYYQLPNEFTHTLWFKTTTTEGGAILTFVNNPWGPTNQDVLVYMSDDGKVHFWMSNGGTPAELSSVDSYNDGAWHSILVTHEVGMLMEIDGGDEFLQISTPITHLTFDGYWTFAGPAVPATVSALPTSLYFNGQLDDLLCINESRYILRNYLDEVPELDAEVQGMDTICGLGLAYFNIYNSENGIEYRAWNNTLSAWNGIAGTGTGGLISIGGDLINSSSDFIIYATDPVTTCETILDTVFTITVMPVLTPTISISGDGSNPLCAGTEVNFTALVSNAGTNPTIEWYFNGVAQGVNNTNFSHNFDLITDDVYAIATSDYICTAVPSATSNTILYTVIPQLTPSVSISELPSGIACTETIVDFAAVAVDCGANPDYEWYLNGVHVGLNSDSYSHAGWIDGDEVYALVIPDYVCSSSPSAQSNTITISVSTPPVADYEIISGGYCLGEDICFEYSGETAGLDHVEWEINDGGTPASFSGEGPHCYTPTTSVIDIIVYAYDAYGCNDTALFFAPILSGSITPSVSIVSSQSAAVCEYETIGYTATPINCGFDPVYQWYRNGVPVGTNSNEYHDNYFLDNEEVWVVVTNDISCATSSTAESNHLFTDISFAPTASLTVSGTNCIGEQICLYYNGGFADLTNIEWEIWDGAMLYFSGVGPHCFTPVTINPQITVFSYNSLGCSDSATTILAMTGTPPELNIYDTIYHCPQSFASFSAPDTYESYSWSNGLSTNYFHTLIDGLYYLTVSNSSGCIDVDSLLVVGYPDNGFNWPEDTTVCIDATLILNTEYPYNSYHWFVGTLHEYFVDEISVVYEGVNPIEVALYAEDENCQYVDTMNVHFETCEYVDIAETVNINVFPNPTYSILNFEAEATIENLIIFDMTGKVLFVSDYENRIITVDVKNWAAGEYYYSLTTTGNISIKSKFIKL